MFSVQKKNTIKITKPLQGDPNKGLGFSAPLIVKNARKCALSILFNFRRDCLSSFVVQSFHLM